MSRTAFLAPLAAHRWVRRAADAMLLRYAHHRTAALDRMDAGRVQHDTLLSLVRRARNTRFGRDHDFSRISSLADYQARVPVREYEWFWNTYWKDAYPVLADYVFPPKKKALIANWEEKVARFAEWSAHERITAISGIPAWMLVLFDRLKKATGKSSVAEVWPDLRLVIHGGTKFDPFRELFKKEIGNEEVKFCEVYPCSEGFVATEDPRYGQLRMVPDHDVFFEFIPFEELGRDRPARHTLADVEVGQQYAVVITSCAGLWSYLVGDTVAFERRTPPLIRFTGRTKYFLSAFGEHLISEEVEKAIARAASECGVDAVDFHVGPVFPGYPRRPGHHLYLIEFAGTTPDVKCFAELIDAELSAINEDYAPHRQGDLAMLMPEVRVVRKGGFGEWMRAKGKYGGQHKVPRMDNSGKLTQDMATWFAENGWLV